MATRTSVSSGAWSASSTWDTGVPVDGDTVVIAAGHSVEFDVDQSGWTGLAGLTIHGGVTPGMLYAKYSSAGTYCLKIRTGYTIQGTLSTNRGRLVATHDGTFVSSTALPYDRKFTIDLQGTAYIYAYYLDVNMISDDPTITTLSIYAEDYGPVSQSTNVNTTTGVIDFGETLTGLSNGDAVRVRSTGTLPGGLYEEDIYFAYSISGQTCKLYGYIGSTVAIIPDDVGTGNITLYRGWSTSDSTSWGAGKNTPKVLEDVTSDNWAVGDYVVVCNAFDYDAQLCTLSAINSGTVQLSSAVSTNKYPLSKIVLLTRNVQVVAAGPTVNTQVICDYNNGTHDCHYGAIYGTNATNIYGYGLYRFKGSNGFASVIGWCYCAISDVWNTNIAVIAGMSFYGIRYSNNISSDEMYGCKNMTTYMTNSYVKLIQGCNSAFIEYSFYNRADTIIGCKSRGFHYSNYCTAKVITNCDTAVEGTKHAFAERISNCSNAAFAHVEDCAADLFIGNKVGVYSSVNSTVKLIKYCWKAYNYSTNIIMHGGICTNNTYDFADSFNIIAYGTSLRSSVQNLAYLTTGYDETTSQIVYDPMDSSDVIQKDRILVWTPGGYGESAEGGDVPSSPPVSLDWCHKWTFENGDCLLFVDIPIFCSAGETISLPVYVKCSQTPSSMDEHPRVQLYDYRFAEAVNLTLLDDDAISDTTAWQTVIVSYTPSVDTTLVLRVRGKNDSGTMYWRVDPDVYLILSSNINYARRIFFSTYTHNIVSKQSIFSSNIIR